MSKAVEIVAAQDVQVIWQTGDREFDSWKPFDHGANGRIRVFPYLTMMAEAYAASDLAIARAGAVSIAELTACGLPGIFIPLPTATNNHQEHNARSLEKVGAGAGILERNLTPELRAETALGIIKSDGRLREMSFASSRMGRKDAALRIANVILERYGNH